MQLEKKPAVADRGNVANSMLVSARNANRSSGVGSTSESQVCTAALLSYSRVSVEVTFLQLSILTATVEEAIFHLK